MYQGDQFCGRYSTIDSIRIFWRSTWGANGDEANFIGRNSNNHLRL